MKNVASLNLSVNSFPLAWKIQINTSPNEVLARFEPVNLFRFGPDKMGLIFPRSDLSISDLKSLASEPVYSSTVVECSGTMFRRHVAIFAL